MIIRRLRTSYLVCLCIFLGGSRVREGTSMECRSVCDCWCQNDKPELNRSSVYFDLLHINLPNRNSDPSFAGYLPIQHTKVQRCKSKSVVVFTASRLQ